MLLQARIADSKGDSAMAQDFCDQALDIAQGQELLDLKYQCDDLLGQLAERRGDLKKAADYYDRTIREIDEMQSRLVLDERTSFLEDKGSIYQRAVTLALQSGNVDQALIYVEKAKSRVLVTICAITSISGCARAMRQARLSWENWRGCARTRRFTARLSTGAKTRRT